MSNQEQVGYNTWNPPLQHGGVCTKTPKITFPKILTSLKKTGITRVTR